jgi:hypothetical protein
MLCKIFGLVTSFASKGITSFTKDIALKTSSAKDTRLSGTSIVTLYCIALIYKIWKDPPTPANNASTTMYCVIYMGGKLTTCTEMKDTKENKSTSATRKTKA